MFDENPIIITNENASKSNKIFFSLKYIEDVYWILFTSYTLFLERAIVVYVPRRLNPIIGSRLEITCDVHDDRSQNPNTKVTWFKESMPIAFENNPNLSIQDNGRKIVFRSISAMDQGHFMCAIDDPNVAPVVMYIQPHASGKVNKTQNWEILINFYAFFIIITHEKHCSVLRKNVKLICYDGGKVAFVVKCKIISFGKKMA